MRRVAWSAGLLWAVSLAAFPATEEPRSLDFSVSARVEVDASGKGHVVDIGKVTKLSAVPKLVPVATEIAQRLRERIETWQFTPATKDGLAVPSTTSIYVALTGLDDGHGGLEVRIRDASTGGELRDVNMGGLMTALMDARGAEGFVTIDVEYDPSGKVVSASIHDSESFEHGRFVNTADKDLRKGVLKAAQRWVFLPEQIAGSPVTGRGRVPVQLCNSNACSEANIEGAGSSEAHFAALDSAVKLRSAVAGTAL